MKHFNGLYELLGVSRNATSDEIRQAYKRLVQKHHPDKAETEEAYAEAEAFTKELERAARILGDPVTREHYNLTGESNYSTGRSIRQRAGSALAEHFSDWIQRDTSGDPVTEIGKQLQLMIINMYSKINDANSKADELRGLESRVVTRAPDAENLFLAALHERIKLEEDEIKQINEAKLVAEAVIELLKEYDCQEPKPLKPEGVKLLSRSSPNFLNSDWS